MIASMRNTSLAGHFFYSAIVHSVILSFLLALPIYSGDGESSGWYFVYLKNKGKDYNEKASSKMTAAQTKDMIKNAVTNRETPARGKTVGRTAADSGSEPAGEEIDESGRTSPSRHEEVKEPDALSSPDVSVNAEKAEQEEVETKETKIPEPKASGIIDRPPAEEQAQEVEVGKETASQASEGKSDEGALQVQELTTQTRDISQDKSNVRGKQKEVTPAPVAAVKSLRSPGENHLSADAKKHLPPSSEAAPNTKTKEAAGDRKSGRENGSKGQNTVAGISMPKELFPKDIKIEVSGTGEMAFLSARLLKRDYPGDNPKDTSGNKEIELSDKKAEDPDGTGSKRIFSVARADRGIYTFIIENKEEGTQDVDVVFRFYEGEARARTRGYSAVKLLPGKIAKFRFVMPDMIFWDDENRFSGTIEDSNSITKFVYDSGLVWKEDKDY